MDRCSNTMALVHLVLGVLGALNVALGTWLAHRRLWADRRERKRNGDGHAQRFTVAESLYPSESTRSVPGSTPKS